MGGLPPVCLSVRDFVCAESFSVGELFKMCVALLLLDDLAETWHCKVRE